MPCAEERYAAGMIGKAATEGTERAPKEESFRHRHRRGGHRNFLPVPLQYSSLHLIPKVGLCGLTFHPWLKEDLTVGPNLCMPHTKAEWDGQPCASQLRSGRSGMPVLIL